MPTDPNLIDKARRTLERVTTAALATVSPDGAPWNSPVYFAFDGRAFYWSSRCDTVHSTNLVRNPSVFLVVYDSTAEDSDGHAVYIRAAAHELKDPATIAVALNALAHRKKESPKPAVDFVDPQPQRVYEAIPETVWTNAVCEEQGDIHDERRPIDIGALRA
jgi:nitroimidazol reductase NimA-like FMN-containing flavoprotein (pyridoxamine 5'-phosphate oxidase superfamily)